MKPKTPPKQFVYRGVKFTLNNGCGYYRHKDIPGLDVTLAAWTEECSAIVRSVPSRSSDERGSAQSRDPVKALDGAVAAYRAVAQKSVAKLAKEIAAIRKAAKRVAAKRWA